MLDTLYTQVDVRKNDICAGAKYTQLLSVTPFAHKLVTSAFPVCGWRRNHAPESRLKQNMKRHSAIFYEFVSYVLQTGKISSISELDWLSETGTLTLPWSIKPRQREDREVKAC